MFFFFITIENIFLQDIKKIQLTRCKNIGPSINIYYGYYYHININMINVMLGNNKEIEFIEIK